MLVCPFGRLTMRSFFSPEMLMTTEARSPSLSSAVPWNKTLPSTTEPGDGLATATEGLCPKAEGPRAKARGTAMAATSRKRMPRLTVSRPVTALEPDTT